MNKAKKIILFQVTPAVLLIVGAMTTCIAYKAEIDRNIRSAKMKRFDHSAFEYKDIRAMQSLIKCYADAGETPNYSFLLKKSIHSSFFEGAKLAIENGANPNTVDEGGWAPLHFVANGHLKDTKEDREERVQIAELLLENKADINAKTSTGELTPLHLAAGSGQTEMVQLLIKNHAPLFEKDASGSLPIELALKNGHGQTAKILEEAMKTEIGEQKLPPVKVGDHFLQAVDENTSREYQ